MNDEPLPEQAGEEAPAVRAADRRLYAPQPDDYSVQIKRGWEREFCFTANPGEDYFHLLMSGEVYVQKGDERYCLNCALRRGLLTTNRVSWQT